MKKAMLFGTLAMFLGCGTAVQDVDEAESVEGALEMDNGGFDLEDEAPMFGEDPEYEEALDPAVDPELVDPDVDVETFAVDPPDVEDPCNHGVLAGRYIALRAGMGVGRGRVADADRNLLGYMKFIWGTRRDGTKVAFGKYIDLQGRARALFVGRADDGHFQGRWINRAGDRGGLRGRYGDANPERRGGVFAGRWAEHTCDAE